MNIINMNFLLEYICSMKSNYFDRFLLSKYILEVMKTFNLKKSAFRLYLELLLGVEFFKHIMKNNIKNIDKSISFIALNRVNGTSF